MKATRLAQSCHRKTPSAVQHNSSQGREQALVGQPSSAATIFQAWSQQPLPSAPSALPAASPSPFVVLAPPGPGWAAPGKGWAGLTLHLPAPNATLTSSSRGEGWGQLCTHTFQMPCATPSHQSTLLCLSFPVCSCLPQQF